MKVLPAPVDLKCLKKMKNINKYYQKILGK